MTRHLAIFLATFAIGAVIAVVLRTGTHQPYQERRDHPAPAAAGPATEHAGHQAPPTVPAPEHAGHPAGPAAAATPAATGSAVNTICAICGMPVNPALGTIAYKGRLIGFGCRTCPPKFKADPVKYGEAALLNQVVE
jgi:hypothetical protein